MLKLGECVAIFPEGGSYVSLHTLDAITAERNVVSDIPTLASGLSKMELVG